MKTQDTREWIVSIGLNIGDTEPAFQLTRTLGAIARRSRVLRVAMGTSEWHGVPERFVQARAALQSPRSFAAALARELDQDAIAVRPADCRGRWELVDRYMARTPGGALADFPCIVEAPNAADARADMEAAAEHEPAPAAPGTRGADTVGHSSVQSWSAGPVFPAVMVRVESYPAGQTAADAAPVKFTRLIIGAWSEVYATDADAYAVARWVCQNGRINPARYAELVKGRAS